MKISAVSLLTLAAAIAATGAFAQSAPVRGVGLLALNTSDGGGSGSTSVRHSAQIDVPDGGGGGSARATRGGDVGGSGAVASDALSAKIPTPSGEPAAAAPRAPRHTNYRWQALVPGAIK